VTLRRRPPLKRAEAAVEGLTVRVCPYCAEELRDDATVCSTCHNDPSVAPAWATKLRAEPPSAWPSEGSLGTSGLSRVSDTSDDGLSTAVTLEPAAGRGAPVPGAVWGSLALALVSGVVAYLLPDLTAGMVLAVAGHLTGAALGQIGRSAIKNANGRLGGLRFATVTIALNLIQLLFTLVALGPLLPTFAD
jgi:hypothetical protein